MNWCRISSINGMLDWFTTGRDVFCCIFMIFVQRKLVDIPDATAKWNGMGGSAAKAKPKNHVWIVSCPAAADGPKWTYSNYILNIAGKGFDTFQFWNAAIPSSPEDSIHQNAIDKHMHVGPPQNILCQPWLKKGVESQDSAQGAGVLICLPSCACRVRMIDHTYSARTRRQADQMMVIPLPNPPMPDGQLPEECQPNLLCLKPSILAMIFFA